MMILAAAAAAAVALPSAGNYRAEVDGHTYRVQIKGQTVSVYDKALVSRMNPEQMARMKRAVRSATGCGIQDPYFAATKLVGLLQCNAVGERG